MKSILQSIRPQYCELIAAGKKTIEVRKTRPKLDVPFKAYIYCTKGDTLYQSAYNGSIYTADKKFRQGLENAKNTIFNGKLLVGCGFHMRRGRRFGCV